jgi:hypothetical protein
VNNAAFAASVGLDGLRNIEIVFSKRGLVNIDLLPEKSLHL